MKATLFAAGYTGYLIFGLFQIAATASGIQHLTRLRWLSIYGARVAWEWSLLVSFALFIGLANAGNPCRTRAFQRNHVARYQ